MDNESRWSDPKNAYPVLLAGGTGTRLWPVSRERYPKQLVRFTGGDSLVQMTIKRLAPVLNVQNVRIVCGEEHYQETARHVRQTGVNPETSIIYEPCGRNTAPAILLAVLNVLQFEEDAVIFIFPADHVIRDVPEFHEKLKAAVSLAADGNIVTFGITPHYPETGYGYIEGGKQLANGALRLKRFVEKPDRKTAETYLAAGNFFWNSGMFAFRASVILDEFKTHTPDLLTDMKKATRKSGSATQEDYASLPNISIDYAIMEKTENGVILPSDFGWNDIGSWKSLYEFLPKDSNDNVVEGDVITKATNHCFIMGSQRLIAVNHLSGLVVVETPDSIFVSDLENSREVKSIVGTLKKMGRGEYRHHQTTHHSWGSDTLLEKGGGYRVSKMVLYPRASRVIDTDLQRTKNVCVTEGRVKITGDTDSRILETGASVCLEKTTSFENLEDQPLCAVIVETDTA